MRMLSCRVVVEPLTFFECFAVSPLVRSAIFEDGCRIEGLKKKIKAHNSRLPFNCMLTRVIFLVQIQTYLFDGAAGISVQTDRSWIGRADAHRWVWRWDSSSSVSLQNAPWRIPAAWRASLQNLKSYRIEKDENNKVTLYSGHWYCLWLCTWYEAGMVFQI